MKKLCMILLASLVLFYGWNLEKVSFTSEIAAAAKTPDFTKEAKKEAAKAYPLSPVLAARQIWEQTRQDKSLKHYQLTLANGQRNKEVLVIVQYKTGTKKIHSIQVHELK
ncbi:DUF3889 domain-containing protein [Metabacillus sp. 84]|uniref:DUF3889 domain-containing protein n=1 Tax=Metabacillus sp. 84 TaxID=3404705 RepID=UPI003CF5C029